MEPESKPIMYGSPSNFWLYSPQTGFDLTHPSSAQDTVRPRVVLETTTEKAAIDPAKTALVVVDMQNFFLSPALGHPQDSTGIKASEQLLQHAIPACRKAGIRIIWLNWGLTSQEIDEMPPATIKAFAFRRDKEASGGGRRAAGLGYDLGVVEVDGRQVQAGRELMRNQWNSALFAPLEAARQARDGRKADAWVHKNRMSGFWGAGTPGTELLEREGIRTLLFAGVNTDQCVGGSLQDAFTKGYDCLMLSDACATTTPEARGGQACVEYNAARTWGFTLTCEALARAVDDMDT